VSAASYKWKKEDRLFWQLERRMLISGRASQGKPIPPDGTVERSQFVHGFVRYEIRSEVGGNVVVWTPTMQGRSLTVGSKVTVSFKPDTVLAFRYPEEGLEKTISFE